MNNVLPFVHPSPRPAASGNKTISENPPEKPGFIGLENALRDACTRAADPSHPLPIRLQLFRSVTDLAQALMQARIDVALSPTLPPAIIALLDQTLTALVALATNRTVPPAQALTLQRNIISLSKLLRPGRE